MCVYIYLLNPQKFLHYTAWYKTRYITLTRNSYFMWQKPPARSDQEFSVLFPSTLIMFLCAYGICSMMDCKCHAVINGFKNIQWCDTLTVAKGSGLYSETREGRADRLCERNTEVTFSAGNVSVVCAVMASCKFAAESPFVMDYFYFSFCRYVKFLCVIKCYSGNSIDENKIEVFILSN